MERRELLKMFALLGISSTSIVGCAMNAGVSANSKPAAAGFTPGQRQSVEILSELIIPTTDTPGAITAGVPDFIETIYADWYRDGERKIVDDGLGALDAFCQQLEKKGFAEASTGTQVAALAAQEDAAKGHAAPAQMLSVEAEDENAPFFTRMKDLVVLGYYTSEVGSKEELVYLPMPMKFDGNYDFNKVSRQWSS